MTLADTLQEVRELGLSRTAFRVRYELRVRLHRAVRSVLPESPPGAEAVSASTASFIAASPFAPPGDLAAVAEHVDRDALVATARRATHGILRAFSCWDADYGDPIDWHYDPVTRKHWPRTEPWSGALRDADVIGDVKLAWEAARFPQAYHLARAATFAPEHAEEFGRAFEQHVRSFIANNPYGLGIHWYSSQEIALRLLAWTFAIGTFQRLGVDLVHLVDAVARYAYRSVLHIDRESGLALNAIYNNHLLAESLGLVLGGRILQAPEAQRWEAEGLARLEVETDRQFYPDGGSLQNAHNYQRAALMDYLSATRHGKPVPPSFRAAMERALDFLYAHQNEADGTLPNFGANDGSQPAILATTPFADFRPVLQTLSVVTRGERLYGRGPWDEALVWWCGESALEAPLRKRPRTSVTFPHSGYHVLRGGEGTFATFRCGSLHDRFSQIDMLAVNLYHDGRDVLVDPGTYLYNGPQEWHAHFTRTASHNTLEVDGVDQMVHYRRFKYLYWTRARTLAWLHADDHTVVTGEHYGYERLSDPCVHRRSVLLWNDGVCVVHDELRAEHAHRARLQWLTADVPYSYAHNALDLRIPEGALRVAVYDGAGRPLAGDVVRGGESPPRGWVSRHYGEKLPAPSLVVAAEGIGVSFLTIIGTGAPMLAADGGHFRIERDSDSRTFVVEDGALRVTR